jgi:hypothetical protein
MYAPEARHSGCKIVNKKEFHPSVELPLCGQFCRASLFLGNYRISTLFEKHWVFPDQAVNFLIVNSQLTGRHILGSE